MKKVLSIQSHVAFGYVGNRAAVFPLQRLGHDVTAIHTVQFSNHTGYGAWTGQVFAPDHIAEIVDGVAARGGLAGLDAVLSGYLGDPAIGAAVIAAVRRVKAENPGAIWVCDPVMGDVGRGFFVRPGVPAFFRDTALSIADIVTPNQFELAWLTECEITTLDQALAAASALRAAGPRTVLVTSLTYEGQDAGEIEMLALGEEGAFTVATARLPLDPAPNGAGDCTAALFLANSLGEATLQRALERTAAQIYAVFEATAAAGSRELALIAAQDALITPPQLFSARQLA